ncbi:MAG TPA: transcriptional activator NhaR [Candidatus Binatia bacterium]|nr:transcriptional activator NhaR [Candidatus Binatia bacterium]
MEWLNYHHLLYFWAVAREGTIARASAELRLAPQTISGQIHQLEHVLGERLFARRGRHLVLTEVGRVAFRYADEMFSLGRELLHTLKGRPSDRPMRLIVGVADVLPKAVVRRLLDPATRMGQPVCIVCREDKSVDEFMGELAAHKLDLVLTDAPVGPGVPVRAFSHLLGECGTTFFGAPRLAAAYRRGFPRSLDGAPLLLPGANSTPRRVLDQWLFSRDLRPTVVGEFDDSELMNAFGQDGTGMFSAPSVIEGEIRRRHRVRVIGRVESLRHRFYAVSVERKLKHPAVIAICESARKDVFG